MNIGCSSTFLYRTSNGNEYPVELGFAASEAEKIAHDYDFITGLCRSGCKNFNNAGGCPPFAPKFDKIAQEYGYAVLVYARLHSKYKPLRVRESNNYYIHYRFQDIILSNLLHKIGRLVRERFAQNVYYLSNGYCIGCGNRKCAFKEGGRKCRFPGRRTYSLEATGVYVGKTLKNVFGLELEWYDRNNFRQINYLTKVIGFFCREENARDEVQEFLNTFLYEPGSFNGK